jgi:hypothetical protein
MVTVAVLATLALLLVAGCSRGGAEAGGTREAPDGGAVAAAPSEMAGGATSVRLLDLNDRIIRHATLELDIDRGQLAAKIGEANAIVARHKGSTASSSTSAPEHGDAFGQVTFRVPVLEYEATLADLKGLGRYRHEQSDSQDVTGDVVDLGAQIVALKAQERTYLRLLDRTRTISDVLSVERQLVQVRRDLERLEGQLRVLQDRSDFSTIELQLREPGAVAAASRGTFARAWGVALRGLEVGAAAVLVGLVWLVPIVALVTLLLVLLRLARRQRTPAPAAATSGPDS